MKEILQLNGTDNKTSDNKINTIPMCLCREKNIIKPKDIDNAVIYDSYWFPDKTICKGIFLKSTIWKS